MARVCVPSPARHDSELWRRITSVSEAVIARSPNVLSPIDAPPDALLVVPSFPAAGTGTEAAARSRSEALPSEENLIQVFEQAPVGIAVLQGRELRYTFANPRYQQIIGDRDPVGQRLVELFPELAASEIERVIEGVFDTGVSFAASDLFIRFDSKGAGAVDNYYDLVYHPLVAPSGLKRGILVVAVDVTERHAIVARERTLVAAEAARLAAEAALARMRELYQQAPAFIAVVRGPDHVFELANDLYYQLVGRRDIIGKTVLDALPEMRGQGFIELLDGVIATGEPHVAVEMPVVLNRTAGSPPETRLVTFVFQPLREANGDCSGIFAHGIDVTDAVETRRMVETTTAALVASETRYRSLAESVPVQVWTATPEGDLNFVNEQTAAFFGVTAPELLGSGWEPFVHPDDIGPTLDRWRHALSTGTTYKTEFRLRAAAQGEYRWHLARARPERGPGGAITGWVGSNTDVDDERRARAEAEQSNRAKADFLARMSHELRTPLNSIGGYAELLAMGIRGPITAEQRVDLERIQRSQRHLLGLVNSVLNYAKVDAGALQYEIEDVPLAGVLATCEVFIAAQARARKIQLRFSECDGSIAVRADREKTHQIILNLLDNALKFTEPGGTVTLECSRPQDGAVMLRVTDTGRGIAGDQLERVFQPFVQVDVTLTRRHEGTGLGLAISRELARGMGGDLTLASSIGKGSVFTLQLAAAGSSHATLHTQGGIA